MNEMGEVLINSEVTSGYSTRILSENTRKSANREIGETRIRQIDRRQMTASNSILHRERSLSDIQPVINLFEGRLFYPLCCPRVWPAELAEGVICDLQLKNIGRNTTLIAYYVM